MNIITPNNEYISSLLNIFNALYKARVIKNFNTPRYLPGQDHLSISFQEHKSGSIERQNSFNSLNQYFHIEKDRAWAIEMNDHSFILGFQQYDRSKTILKHSYTWWPNPIPDLFDYDSCDIEVEEYFENLKISEINDFIRMRTPVRVDYDYKNRSDTHPACHIHAQHQLTRIPASNPICFIDFIIFILRYGYPDIYNDKKIIIDQLKPRSLKYNPSEFLDEQSVRINWNCRSSK